MTSGNHWTEQDLIELHYGVRYPDLHFKRCGECRSRLEALEKRRQFAISSAGEPAVDFEAQRARTLERIRRDSRRAPWHRRWQITAPLAATAALAAFLLIPREQPTTLIALSDQQLFQEIHDLVVTAEPEAASSIHLLFTEAPSPDSRIAVEAP